MRVTLDTNILVSAFIAKHGHSANVLELALTLEGLELVLSRPILQELGDVLRREEVRTRFTYTDRDIKQIMSVLQRSARMVPVESRFRVVKDDPKDDVILGTAYDGKAEYIVSGDRHLLKMGRFKGIRIVNPKQMAKILARKFPQLMLNL